MVVFISGCVDGDKPFIQTSGPDQCIRAEHFKICMQALPAGPEKTRYNDWDEVVAECSSVAYYLSIRKTSEIKPECR